ncbi:MAG: DMT family transporter [Pseudomonadota bacterium]
MTNTIRQHMTPKEIGLLLLIALLWGGAFFFVEILVESLRPLTIVTARVGLAASLMWLLILIGKVQGPKGWAQWRAFLVIGILSSALPFCLITWAQTRIDSGIASILNATAPLFVVLIAGATLSDERLTTNKLIGVITGIAGVSVLIGPEALTDLGGSALGQLAVIGAALSYGSSAVYSRRFAKMSISPMTVVTGQLTMATVLLLPLVIVFEGGDLPASLPLSAIASIVCLAVFSTFLANVLYFRLLETAGATNSALVGFLMPVTATALGIVFLNETLSVTQVAGAVLIAIGLLVMDGRIFGKAADRS